MPYFSSLVEGWNVTAGRGCCFLILILLAPPLSVSAATIYRWVSPSGAVSYGDQPPSGSHQVQKIVPQPAPPPPPAQPQAPKPDDKLQAEKQIAKEELLAARLRLLSILEANARPPVVIHEEQSPPLLYVPVQPYPHFWQRPPVPPRRPPVLSNGLPSIPPWYTGPWPRQTPNP
jgi:hypothetical protein